MNQELELERTFLAKVLPKEIQGIEPIRITDIYIPDSPAHSHLRLRQKGEKYEITKKNPVSEGDTSAQIEQTIPLDKQEFDALAICSQKVVTKDRYKVTIGGKLAEVDVFMEKLKGLVLIDFEFNSVAEKEAFIMPDVALADVTQEEFVAGGMLAGKAYDDLIPNLSRFNYQKI